MAAPPGLASLRHAVKLLSRYSDVLPSLAAAPAAASPPGVLQDLTGFVLGFRPRAAACHGALANTCDPSAPYGPTALLPHLAGGAGGYHVARVFPEGIVKLITSSSYHVGCVNTNPRVFPKGIVKLIPGATTVRVSNPKAIISKGISKSKAGVLKIQGRLAFDPLGMNQVAPYRYLTRRFVHGPNVCGSESNLTKEKLSPKLSPEELAAAASRLALKLTEELSPEERDAVQRLFLDTMAKVLLDSWTNMGVVQKRIPYTGPFAEVLDEMFKKLQDYVLKGFGICGANILLGLAFMGISLFFGEGVESGDGGDNTSGVGAYSTALKTGLVGILLGAMKNPGKPASPAPPSPAPPPPSPAPPVSNVVIVMGAVPPFYLPAVTLQEISRNLSQQIARSHHGDKEVGHHGEEVEGRHGHGDEEVEGHHGHGDEVEGHHGHGVEKVEGHHGHGDVKVEGHHGHGDEKVEGRHGHGDEVAGHHGHGDEVEGRHGHGDEKVEGRHGHGDSGPK